MAYTLEEFCKDCRDAIRKDPGNGGREAIRAKLALLLQNTALVEKECAPDRPMGTYTLYHDPETDFHVLSHCFDKGSKSPPHDHGRSWAIYGQARHFTDMTVWRRKDDRATKGHAELEVAEQYRLNPGEVGIFHPGDIHSIDFPDGARFIRVTGTDLNTVDQAIYNLKDQTVKIASAATAINNESRARAST
jgi:predicted metal-dependent enzyme (double-stranded beta helix superfamily)